MNSTLRRFPDFRILSVTGAMLAFIFSSVTLRAAAPRNEVLEAIHRVENPHDSSRPGRYGELGAYQFRASTWRMHTNLPFEYAIDPDVSETVAVRHDEWIKSGLERNGIVPTSYNIALAWNGGLRAAVRGHSSAAARDYAQRVSNIVQEMRAARLANAR